MSTYQQETGHRKESSEFDRVRNDTHATIAGTETAVADTPPTGPDAQLAVMETEIAVEEELIFEHDNDLVENLGWEVETWGCPDAWVHEFERLRKSKSARDQFEYDWQAPPELEYFEDFVNQKDDLEGQLTTSEKAELDAEYAEETAALAAILAVDEVEAQEFGVLAADVAWWRFLENYRRDPNPRHAASLHRIWMFDGLIYADTREEFYQQMRTQRAAGRFTNHAAENGFIPGLRRFRPE